MTDADLALIERFLVGVKGNPLAGHVRLLVREVRTLHGILADLQQDAVGYKAGKADGLKEGRDRVIAAMDRQASRLYDLCYKIFRREVDIDTGHARFVSFSAKAMRDLALILSAESEAEAGERFMERLWARLLEEPS